MACDDVESTVGCVVAMCEWLARCEDDEVENVVLVAREMFRREAVDEEVLRCAEGVLAGLRLGLALKKGSSSVAVGGAVDGSMEMWAWDPGVGVEAGMEGLIVAALNRASARGS
jgi:hypothetical protein